MNEIQGEAALAVELCWARIMRAPVCNDFHLYYMRGDKGKRGQLLLAMEGDQLGPEWYPADLRITGAMTRDQIRSAVIRASYSLPIAAL